MPADVDYLRGLAIEAFNAARHDRTAFTCGTDRIDYFLKITASKYVAGDIGRIYVIVKKEGGRLVGFYTVNPHALDASEFEADMNKPIPRLDRIPAYSLSVIGTHVDGQSKGVGSVLLADVLKRCVQASEQMGGRFVILDAFNDDAARLYGRYDFVPLPSVPGRMVVSIAKPRANEAERLRRRKRGA